MLSSDCNTCHGGLGGGKFPVGLGISDGGTGLDPIACVGCHGREQDAGNDNIFPGRGMGLRQHHENANMATCFTVGCHIDSTAIPAGEEVLPPYYFTPDPNHVSKPTDSCNADGSESAFTTIGLDNDGDLDYDGDDLDCPAPGPIDGDGDAYFSDVDCDDSDASVNPGATEVCYDGIDNDCDGYRDSTDLDCVPGFEQPIITLLSHQYLPSISGNKIVWFETNENGYEDIYMYDLSSPAQGEVLIVTDTFQDENTPNISDDKIVWAKFNVETGSQDIYMYDPAQGEVPISTHTAFQRDPAISGDKIVWQDYRNGNPDIYMYDLSKPAQGEVQITADPAYQDLPTISGDKIVWEDGRNGNYSDIYMYDLSNPAQGEVQITTDPAQPRFPNISGDKIVWEDGRNGNSDIYMYDPVQGEVQITTDPEDQRNPAISGNKIVWEDYRNGWADIYMYDLSNPAQGEVQITTDWNMQLYPEISGNKIVWQDFRNLTTDIYMYVISTVSGDTPTGSEVPVQPPDSSSGGAPVTLTFDDVTQAGTTTLTVSDTGPTPPSGFRLLDPETYYEIITTALYSGSIKVCIDYGGMRVTDESQLKLEHYESGQWKGDPNQTIDIQEKEICATFSSTSPFAIFERYDSQPPVTKNVKATPNPVAVGTGFTLTATVIDSWTGGSAIISADCIPDGNTSLPMDAQDGSFDAKLEIVTGTIPAFAESGLYNVCVHGRDIANSDSGPEECITLVVYDPTGGFVTGGGWIDSPEGAYVPNPSLTGKANFGFISKYKKGASEPTGQTEFQFRVADLKEATMPDSRAREPSTARATTSSCSGPAMTIQTLSG
jgi:beta propeller repeat protein